MSPARLLAATVAALALTGCTVSQDDAQTALHAQGFTNIQLGGMALFGCDEHDDFTRTFTATGADGARVKGVVCGGLMKGATVRITGHAS